MIKLLPVFILAFFSLNLQAVRVSAQEITVRDISTYSPLGGVKVRWHHAGRDTSLLTSEKGKVILPAVADTTAFSFERIGYEPLQLTYSQMKSAAYTVGIYRAIYSFDEVVISASRHEESRRDITQQIELIDARETALLNRQTTADLLQSTGQIMVQKSQAGGGSPVLRGFEANKVLLVVDGIRMNNAIYRGGHLQNVISIDQNMLEKTEIAFGPGSVVYGSDALGGTVHFRTKSPAFSPDSSWYLKAKAMSRYASANNEITLHAGAEAANNHLSSYTAFTASSFGDMRMGANRQDKYKDWGKRDFIQEYINNKDTIIRNPDPNKQSDSGYDQLDLIQKLSFTNNGSLIHRLNLQYSTSTDVPRYDRLTDTTENGTLKYAEWYYGPQKRFLGSYSLIFIKPSKLFSDAEIHFGFQDIKESRNTRKFGNDWRDTNLEHVNVYSLNADFEKKQNGHETRYGAEITYNNVTSTSRSVDILSGATRTISTRYPAGGSNVIAAAMYLTHTWEITEKTIVSGGLRYSASKLTADFGDTAFYKLAAGETEQTPSSLSGSAGIVFLPTTSSKLSLSFASGFRAPNVDDLAKVFESGSGTVIVPNPDLGPEYTYTAEAGFNKSFNDKVFLEGYGWYTWYRDAITLGDFLYNGQDTIVYDGEPSAVRANVNSGKAYLYGSTLIIKAALTKKLRFTTSMSYTYGRIVTDSSDIPLDHIPPLIGRTGFEFEHKKLILNLYSEYHGKKAIEDYNINGEDNIQYATADGTPGWITFNIGGSYAITKHLMVQSSLENILDTHYRVFASGISAPGRNLIFSLRAEF